VEQYVALDVSLQKIAVCVLTASGRVVIEAEVASEPGALIAFIRTKAPHAVRIGLESGPTSPPRAERCRADYPMCEKSD
jgi:transposase